MIIKTKFLGESINIEDATFSSSSARPSRSLISVDLYNEYNKLNKIFDQVSNLNSDKIILPEILLYIFRYTLCKYDVKCENLIIVNGSINVHIINEQTLKKITEKILDINIVSGDYLMININDIYTYPCIEYIILICHSFMGCNIHRSKINSMVYIIFYSFKTDFTILGKLLSKWVKNIRFIGICVPIDIQKDILYFNDSFFRLSIESNIILNTNMTIEKNDRINNEKKINYDYYNKYIKCIHETCETCTLTDFMTKNCTICINCFSLFY
jgi:hypothetical protein